MTPQGEIVYDYLISTMPVLPVKKVTKIASINTSPLVSAVRPLEGVKEAVLGENLYASAINSENGNGNNYVPMFIFVLFLGTTSSAVYFIRRKKIPVLTGDDFELLYTSDAADDLTRV